MAKSKENIEDLRKIAVAADLEGRDFLYQFTSDQLADGYNGIGPEWAGASIRAKVTRYITLFEPAALVHDMRYYMSDGSRKGFNYANMEFHENCLKLADHAYPWWNWRRYRARLVAHALYDFVRGNGGWKAWIDPNRKDNK